MLKKEKLLNEDKEELFDEFFEEEDYFDDLEFIDKRRLKRVFIAS